MKTTTIQIYEDVMEHLEKQRKNKKETYNEILRKIFNMDIPEEKIESPHYYRGIIEVKDPEDLNWQNNPIIDAIVNKDEDGGGFSYGDSSIFAGKLNIDDVEVYVNISQPLKISVIGKTEKEICEKIDKLITILKLPSCIKPEIYGVRSFISDCKTGENKREAAPWYW